MKNKVFIADGRAVNNHSAYITVEIGLNNNQDFNNAKQMIDNTTNAGTDAVIFQTYETEILYSRNVVKFYKDDVYPFDLIKENELTWS